VPAALATLTTPATKEHPGTAVKKLADRGIDVRQPSNQCGAEDGPLAGRARPDAESLQRAGDDLQVGQGHHQLVIRKQLDPATPDSHAPSCPVAGAAAPSVVRRAPLVT